MGEGEGAKQPQDVLLSEEGGRAEYRRIQREAADAAKKEMIARTQVKSWGLDPVSHPFRVAFCIACSPQLLPSACHHCPPLPL